MVKKPKVASSLYFFMLVWLPGAVLAQDYYTAKDLQISFYSDAPLKKFQSHSPAGVSVIDLDKQTIRFSVDISSFIFDRLLMQEHFNREFMHSKRYPQADFKGTFTGPLDLHKDGEYPVTVEGKMNIHGKRQNGTYKGLIKVANGKVFLSSQFKVNCEDFGISIPPALQDKIASTILVKVKGRYEKTLRNAL